MLPTYRFVLTILLYTDARRALTLNQQPIYQPPTTDQRTTDQPRARGLLLHEPSTNPQDSAKRQLFYIGQGPLALITMTPLLGALRLKRDVIYILFLNAPYWAKQSLSFYITNTINADDFLAILVLVLTRLGTLAILTRLGYSFSGIDLALLHHRFHKVNFLDQLLHI